MMLHNMDHAVVQDQGHSVVVSDMDHTPLSALVHHSSWPGGGCSGHACMDPCHSNTLISFSL